MDGAGGLFLGLAMLSAEETDASSSSTAIIRSFATRSLRGFDYSLLAFQAAQVPDRKSYRYGRPAGF
ncbi:MAG: hypothetical protein WKF84_08575 [Pyrinomonadaceae bacterium]